MPTVRDLMTTGVQCLPATQTLDRAAQLMRDHGVGALPVQHTAGGLAGIITDRDIVVKCVAAGHDPARVTAGDLVEGEAGPVSVDAGADASEAVRRMREARVRRLPVLEGSEPVGIVTEADLARGLSERELVEFVVAVYA